MLHRFVVAVLAVSVLACSEQPTRRTWRPSDHAQPPGVGAPSAPTAAAPVSPEVARLQAGQALFGLHCASCHGAGGRGDGRAAAPVARPTDLTNAAFQEARSDAALAAAIRNGRGAMPAFGEVLDEPGILALVGYVRSLRAGPAAP